MNKRHLASLFLRIAIGGVLIFTAWQKLVLIDHHEMVVRVATRAFQVNMTSWTANIVVRSVFFWELLAAQYLIFAWNTSFGAKIGVSLGVGYLMFLLALSTQLKGDLLECGCFGIGPVNTNLAFMRAAGFIGANYLLLWVERNRGRKGGICA